MKNTTICDPNFITDASPPTNTSYCAWSTSDLTPNNTDAVKNCCGALATFGDFPECNNAFTYCNTTNIAVTDNIINDCLIDALVNYSLLICGLDKKSGAKKIERVELGDVGCF
jgi:hypothetical protein